MMVMPLPLPTTYKEKQEDQLDKYEGQNGELGISFGAQGNPSVSKLILQLLRKSGSSAKNM